MSNLTLPDQVPAGLMPLAEQIVIRLDVKASNVAKRRGSVAILKALKQKADRRWPGAQVRQAGDVEYDKESRIFSAKFIGIYRGRGYG